MKVRVTNGVVKDRTTGRYCQPGDVLEVTKERYDEIRAKGDFVEVVKSAAGKKKAADTESEAQSDDSPAEEPEPDPELLHVEGMPDSVQYIEDTKKR